MFAYFNVFLVLFKRYKMQLLLKFNCVFLSYFPWKYGNPALLGIICEKEQNKCLLVVRKFKADTDNRYFNTNTKTYKIAFIQKWEKYIHYKFQNCSSEKSLVSMICFQSWHVCL